MKGITKPELERKVSETITSTLELLEELYIVYHSDSVEELDKVNLPFGDRMRVTDLIVMLFRILGPLLDLAKQQWPEAISIMSWAENIALSVMVSHKKEE